MDRRLITQLALTPGAWPACLQVMYAMALKKPEVTVNRQGFRVATKVGGGEGLFCAVAGTAYEQEMGWLIGRMVPGDCFIDVGANIGLYSIHAARKVSPDGRVFAFEPTPSTHEILLRNVRSNSLQNIDCYQMALADESGFLALQAGDRPASNRVERPNESTRQENLVRSITLDEFCAEHSIIRLNFIKADIEGGELAFFKGAGRTLENFRPTILFESMHTGPTFPERQLLRSFGYILLRLSGKGLEVVENDSMYSGNIIAEPQ